MTDFDFAGVSDRDLFNLAGRINTELRQRSGADLADIVRELVRHIEPPLPEVPADFAVKELRIADSAIELVTCGACGRSWDNGIATGWTPAPSSRCPFEYFHRDDHGPKMQVTIGTGVFNTGWEYDADHAELVYADGFTQAVTLDYELDDDLDNQLTAFTVALRQRATIRPADRLVIDLVAGTARHAAEVTR